MSERVAIIDLGSNSCRMTVFDIHRDGTFSECRNLRDMVRLSEGMGEERILTDASMNRAINSLLKFRAMADSMEVSRIRAFGTAAVRFAQNGAEFVRRVKESTDIDLEVIDGKTEAYYDYLAVTHTLPVTDCLLTDTGGGSTEFILIKDKKLRDVVSLPLGAVLLLEEYGRREDAMLQAVKEAVKEGVPFLEEAEGLPICAMGGSARALTALTVGDKREAIHGKVLTMDEVYRSVDLIQKTPFEDRKEIPYMEPGRSDIMFSGCAPVRVTMSLIHSPQLICCQTGLRDGVLYAILDEMKEGT